MQSRQQQRKTVLSFPSVVKYGAAIMSLSLYGSRYQIGRRSISQYLRSSHGQCCNSIPDTMPCSLRNAQKPKGFIICHPPDSLLMEYSVDSIQHLKMVSYYLIILLVYLFLQLVWEEKNPLILQVLEQC